MRKEIGFNFCGFSVATETVPNGRIGGTECEELTFVCLASSQSECSIVVVRSFTFLCSSRHEKFA